MSKTDLNTFKNALPKVKDMIRKTLKVDAGTQSAYDIMAVSRGYPNFHAVKAISSLPYYELRTSISDNDEFYAKVDLGHLNDNFAADNAARQALKGCQHFHTWFLYRDGENTQIRYETIPTPEKGLVYQIEVTGDTLADVEQGLEEVVRRLDNVMGFDRNESGSFSFQRAGEEWDGSEDLLDSINDNILTTDDFALIDSTGILVSSNDEQQIEEKFNFAQDDIENWKGFLSKACQILPEVLVENSENEFDTATYIVIANGLDGFDEVFRGDSGEMVERIKERPTHTLMLFEEMAVIEGSK